MNLLLKTLFEKKKFRGYDFNLSLISCLGTIMTKLKRTLRKRLLLILCFVEMWERFGYYGMRALLVLFLVKYYGFHDAKAYLIYSLYSAICYVVPVFAGTLADKLLGYKNLIISGGAIICLGHFILAFLNFNEALFNLGLATIAIGSGFFKGNIANLLGTFYHKESSQRDKGFTSFYIAINLGGFIAPIFCGFVAEHFGWDYGFGLAGIGMLIGLLTFIAFSDKLKEHGNAPKLELTKIKKLISRFPIAFMFSFGTILVVVAFFMLQNTEIFVNILAIFGLLFLFQLFYIIYKSNSRERQSLVFLTILILFFMMIFALEMQLGSLINIFTDRHIDRSLFGYEIPTAVLQFLNPFTILILGFAINAYFKKMNNKFTLIRFGFGIALSGLCFLTLYYGCVSHDMDYKINIMFLIIGMIFMALSELFVAPILMSMTTYIAPHRLRGFMMGFLMFSVSYSNLSGVLIAKYMSVPKDDVNMNLSLSLEKYESGFLKIAILYLILLAIFLILYKFLMKVYSRETSIVKMPTQEWR